MNWKDNHILHGALVAGGVALLAPRVLNTSMKTGLVLGGIAGGTTYWVMTMPKEDKKPASHRASEIHKRRPEGKHVAPSKHLIGAGQSAWWLKKPPATKPHYPTINPHGPWFKPIFGRIGVPFRGIGGTVGRSSLIRPL